jgi:hypothetical protein
MSSEDLNALHRSCEKTLEEARRTLEETRRHIERVNHSTFAAGRQRPQVSRDSQPPEQPAA